ncbi:MAG: hypothetical protein LBH58_07795 [Tannerellaceae bacterium]|jgi:hypothetical protein|nr:hypothetical protein [Tannerellaceae bacterium]
MFTQKNAAGGNTTDLLSSIYKIKIRNEEKISEADRLFCEKQQESLYLSLNEIDRWYGIFVEDAAKYGDSHKVTFLINGKVRKSDPYNDRCDYAGTDYTEFEFKPFDNIDKLVDQNYKAINAFAKSIIKYFNNTYNVSVPYPDVDKESLQMGFRPGYQSYVDLVIEHLGGKSFRDTAEDELIKRFHIVVKSGTWSKVNPELKKDKIIFPDIIRFDDFWTDRNKMHYNYQKNLDDFCAGIAFGAANILIGSLSMIIRFDSGNINILRPYSLTISNADQMKFFKNGRIDVQFKDAKTAEACFYKLRLDSIQ